MSDLPTVIINNESSLTELGEKESEKMTDKKSEDPKAKIEREDDRTIEWEVSPQSNEAQDEQEVLDIHRGEENDMEKNGKEKNDVEKGSTLDSTKSEKVFFYAEAFVTSGPRKEKRIGNSELGEDTCGFVMLGDKLLFWVLDGESQKEFIRDKKNGSEIFSSRLMAQALSSFFPIVFQENEMQPPHEILQEAMDRCCYDWVSKNEVQPRQLFEEAKHCCTTILLGVLDQKGKLLAHRIGDSKAIIFDNHFNYIDSELAQKPADENNIGQFFSAQLNSENQLKLYTAEGPVQGQAVKGEEFAYENVQTLLCYSDGISSEIEKKIRNLPNGSIKEIRDAIFQMPQSFQDDKSLLFLKICTD